MLKPVTIIKISFILFLIGVNAEGLRDLSTVSTESIVANITTTSTAVLTDAEKLAKELYANATAYATQVLKDAQAYSQTGGILAETVYTSLALIGLSASYTSYDKMQKACDALTYVNHYSQCLIHRYSGYWCCATKNLSTGTASCKAYSDADAKVLVDTPTTNSNNFRYYCSGNMIKSIFGVLAILLFTFL